MPGRDPLPEAKFERNVLDFQEPIQLEAPPRTLTLDQHKFPSLGENASGNQKKVQCLRIVLHSLPFLARAIYYIKGLVICSCLIRIFRMISWHG